MSAEKSRIKAAKQTLNLIKSKLAPPSLIRPQWLAAWLCVLQTVQPQELCALFKVTSQSPTGLMEQKVQPKLTHHLIWIHLYKFEYVLDSVLRETQRSSSG
jgi:hypothetical protein